MWETILIALFSVGLYMVTGITAAAVLPGAALVIALGALAALKLRRSPEPVRGLAVKAAIYLISALAVIGWSRADMARAEDGAAKILSAAKAYSLANGKMPASLQDLKPAYLESIPRAKSVATNSVYFIRGGSLLYVGDPTTHLIGYDLVTGEKSYLPIAK